MCLTGVNLDKKGEVQKKDEHENRNAILTGFLLALLPCIIILLWGWSATGFKSIGDICPPCKCIGVDCMGCGYICPFKVLLYGELPTLYLLIYLPLGVVLYILSLSRSIKKFDAKNKFRLQFWAKFLLVGGVFGIALTALMPLILNLG